MHSNPKPLRTVRSFVRRESRSHKRSEQRFAALWKCYGIESEQIVDWAEIFGCSGEIVLEIGFGDGQSLLEMARDFPEKNYVGVEVYRTGMSQLMQALEKESITNVRLFCGDAVEILSQQVPDHSLTKIQIFFPDPWPKARHHKRRLIQPGFIELLTKKLSIGGSIHLATDWMNYAYHMMEVLSMSDILENTAGCGNFLSRPNTRSLTKYERRGLKLGHQTWDLMFQKI